MSRRAQYAALAVAMFVLAALAMSRSLLGGGARPPNRAVIVLDRSDSTRDICSAVLGVAETLLSETPWPKGSSLVLLATGNDETLGEPIELFRFADFRRAKSVEGKGGGVRRIQELLGRIGDACSHAVRTHTSPIYLAVRRGAEMLASSGCAPERCMLAVISDGEETVESGMVAALRASARARTLASSVPAIPNEAARVRFCGFAETVAVAAPQNAHDRGRHASAPKRDAHRADRLFDLWRSAFSRPAGVELSPICPKRQLATAP